MHTSAQRLVIRLTAMVAVLCVLALTVFAASPGLHAWLHGHDTACESPAAHHHDAPVSDEEQGCVVSLYAQGVLTLLVICLWVLARPVVPDFFSRATDDIVVARPAYWLVPSHAPPVR